MCLKNDELLARLMEIREACEVATLPEDNNFNLIIEEIEMLASICIEKITRK